MELVRCCLMLCPHISCGIHFPSFKISPYFANVLQLLGNWWTLFFSGKSNVECVRAITPPKNVASHDFYILIAYRCTVWSSNSNLSYFYLRKPSMVPSVSSRIISVGFINHLPRFCWCLYQFTKKQYTIARVFSVFLNTKQFFFSTVRSVSGYQRIKGTENFWI